MNKQQVKYLFDKLGAEVTKAKYTFRNAHPTHHTTEQLAVAAEKANAIKIEEYNRKLDLKLQEARDVLMLGTSQEAMEFLRTFLEELKEIK